MGMASLLPLYPPSAGRRRGTSIISTPLPATPANLRAASRCTSAVNAACTKASFPVIPV